VWAMPGWKNNLAGGLFLDAKFIGYLFLFDGRVLNK
jgi:hypothetical protein